MSRETLRALADAATPGPWTESGRDVDHDRFVAEGKNPGDVCGLGCEIDGPAEAWLRGQFHLHADAAFIAASRSAVPLLLDISDAAAALADSPDTTFREMAGQWSRLRAALAALEGSE